MTQIPKPARPVSRTRSGSGPVQTSAAAGPSRKTRPEKIAGQVGHTGHPMARFGRSSLLTRVPQNAQMFRRKRSIPTAGNLTRTAFRCPELRGHRRERCFGHPRRDMGLLNPLESEHCPYPRLFRVKQLTPKTMDYPKTAVRFHRDRRCDVKEG
jgi:hypothetical protein